MKIIEIIPTLSTGGGERFVIDLSNSFANQGHDVEILTLYDLSEKDILLSHVQDNVKLKSFSKKRGSDFACMIKIFRYLYSAKSDVIHVHLSAITYMLLSSIFLRKGCIFATIHSEARREAGTGLSKWIRKILFRLDLVSPITISIESEESFKKFYNRSGYIITNGSSTFNNTHEVNQQFVNYRRGVDYLFLHAGRIHDVKNQLMLVKAFDKILKQGIKARLLIAGRIEDFKIFNMLKKYFSENIIYVGELSDIRSLMSQCDAFCLSSKMEGMPITVIEAFSVGCVPIVTPVGGCKNIIVDGKNGFIASDITEDSYCEAILKYINIDSEMRENIIKNMKQEFIQNYSIDHVAQKYVDYFIQKNGK